MLTANEGFHRCLVHVQQKSGARKQTHARRCVPTHPHNHTHTPKQTHLVNIIDIDLAGVERILDNLQLSQLCRAPQACP
jgi:hypothetical protein